MIVKRFYETLDILSLLHYLNQSFATSGFSFSVRNLKLMSLVKLMNVFIKIDENLMKRKYSLHLLSSLNVWNVFGYVSVEIKERKKIQI